MQTAYRLVALAAERTPNHPALVDDRGDRTLTYRGLVAEVEAIAAGLAERGVGRGSRVATVLPNLFEHGLVLLALQRLGAVPALLNHRLPPDQIVALVTQGEMIGAVIRDDPVLAQTLAAALPSTRALLSVGGTTGAASDLANCRGDAATLPPVPEHAGEETAFIFYTSGTTGAAKGVLVPHRSCEPRMLWVSTLTGLRCGTELRTLGVSPLSHAIGFFGTFLVTLAYNGTFYTVSAFDPAQAVEMVARHRITYLFSVPTVFQALLSAPNYRPDKFDSLDLAMYGGAAATPALLDRLTADWRAPIRNAYGTTETMCALYHPDPVGRARMLRVGYGSRVRVVRIGGSPDDVVEEGSAGELIVDAAGEQVFTGYLGLPAETAAKLRDGWYFTGDVVVRRRDGEFELVGRADDMIRSGGESVYPEEVEAVLTGHPGVAEVCVTGIPDPLWGEMVVACVVRRDPSVTWGELDALCLDGPLAAFKRPRAYFFTAQLVKNAANKIQRRAIRDAILAMRQAGGEELYHVAA